MQVDPALRKKHKAYFRGFFILRTALLINGQPAEVGPNEQGWLTLRCPNPNAEVTFDDLYTKVSATVEKCSGLHISNYWCDDVPVFQLNVSSADDLKKLLHSKSQLQKQFQLASKFSQMFKREPQVQLQSDVFLVLPSASGSDGQIVHVTLDNAVECMAQWERSAAFTFQDIFQQWNDHSWRTEPTMGMYFMYGTMLRWLLHFQCSPTNTGPDSLGDLVNELDDIAAKWVSFGIKLEVPYHELQIISHDHGQNARRCMAEMMKWWLDHNLEAKWSSIVQALAKIGKRHLACRIAQSHGLYIL